MRKYFGKSAILTVGVLGGNAQEYHENFKIEFQIQKALDSQQPNKADVRIYNVRREFFEQVQESDNAYMSITAGYKELAGEIYSGDISNITYGENGVDSYVDITAGDGLRALNLDDFKKSYRPDMNPADMAGDIIDSVISITGAGLSAVAENVLDLFKAEGKKEKGGRTIREKAGKELKKLLNKYDYDYTVQNGEIEVFAVGDPIDTTQPVITPYSGMKSFPQTRKERYTDGEEQKYRNILEVTTLIIPEIIPGRYCLVKTDKRDWGGIAIRQRISGATLEGAWEMTTEIVYE